MGLALSSDRIRSRDPIYADLAFRYSVVGRERTSEAWQHGGRGEGSPPDGASVAILSSSTLLQDAEALDDAQMLCFLRALDADGDGMISARDMFATLSAPASW